MQARARFRTVCVLAAGLLAACVGVGPDDGNGGVGKATLVASGQDRPRAVAVTDGYVAWLNEGDGETRAGTVMALPREGVAAPKIVASSHLLPQSIRAAGGKLYYSVAKTSAATCEDGGVYRVDPASGAREHLWWWCIEDFAELVDVFALDASSVFIAATEYERTDIVAVPRDGGTERSVDENVGPIAAMAVAQGHVYWARTASPELVRASVGGGEPETVVPNLLLVDMDVAGGRLVWATADGVIERYDPSDGAREVVAEEQYGVTAVDADGDDVFWVRREDDGGSIWLGGVGRTPTAVAEDLEEPYDVIADDEAVYWVDRSAGEVWMAPR